MKIKSLFLFLFLLLLNSCATFKQKTITGNQKEITAENLKVLNGTYKVNEKENPKPLSYFWGSYYKMKEYYSVSESVPYFVTLNVLNEKKIEVVVKADDFVLKSYTIKGKIKNGYFQQRTKTFAIPALLFNIFHSSKFRIGLLKNNDLVTHFKKIEFGTVYIYVPFNNKEFYNNSIHKRVE